MGTARQPGPATRGASGAEPACGPGAGSGGARGDLRQRRPLFPDREGRPVHADAAVRARPRVLGRGRRGRIGRGRLRGRRPGGGGSGSAVPALRAVPRRAQQPLRRDPLLWQRRQRSAGRRCVLRADRRAGNQLLPARGCGQLRDGCLAGAARHRHPCRAAGGRAHGQAGRGLGRGAHRATGSHGGKGRGSLVRRRRRSACVSAIRRRGSRGSRLRPDGRICGDGDRRSDEGRPCGGVRGGGRGRIARVGA